LNTKNLDFIVLNSMRDKGAGFSHPTNRVSIINKDGQVYEYELKSKTEVAADILNYITEKFLQP